MEHVVTGALIQNERLLLCRRSAGRVSYPGVWDLPGGHVEPGEAPLDALVRELTEELGVVITRPAGPPRARLHPLAHQPDFELAIWVVTAWEGSVTNCAPVEHDELRWFDVEEWSALSFAHHEYRTVFASAMLVAREASRA